MNNQGRNQTNKEVPEEGLVMRRFDGNKLRAILESRDIDRYKFRLMLQNRVIGSDLRPSEASIGGWLNKRILPTSDYLLLIADTLDVVVDDLCTEVNQPHGTNDGSQTIAPQ